MAIIDRVKWDGSPNVLAWKFPSEELSTWSQLIVNESQVAFVVKDGVYDGPFGAGRHVLATDNIPFLRKVIGIPYGGKTPFAAEVWYVNKLINLDIRWGTQDPIQLQDPKFGIMVPVRAFGQYGMRIEDAKTFLLKLVGVLPRFDVDTLSEYFKGVFITKIKNAIADAILLEGRSVLDMSTRLEYLSDKIKAALEKEVAEYGVALTQFNVNSINIPDADPALQKVKAALARRAEMGIVGYNYQQERSLDILHAAARNEGNAGSLLGAGMGAGMGVAIGAPVAQAFQQMAGQLQPSPEAEDSHVKRIQLLKDLAELRSQNILTEAEFDAEKRRILAA